MKYGMIPELDTVGGVVDMRESAKELSVYIDKVLAATEAQRVDLVAHSEGGTVSR